MEYFILFNQLFVTFYYKVYIFLLSINFVVFNYIHSSDDKRIAPWQGQHTNMTNMTQAKRGSIGAVASSWTVTGRQMLGIGWANQAESASNELTAGVGLYKSHHTWVEASWQASPRSTHPAMPPYGPSPQHAIFTSSNPECCRED